MAAVFFIVSRASGKALTRTGDGGSPIQQFTMQDDNTNQMWTFTQAGAGAPDDFRIAPWSAGASQPGADPGLAIAVKPGSDPTQPAPLALTGAPGQTWRKNRTVTANIPYFFLLEGENDFLMDVPGGSGDDGVTIQVYPRNEHDNQQWTFLPAFSQLGMFGA